MSADTLEVYRHSGKFTVPGLILPFAGAAIAGFPLGLAYAYLTRWIPFVYINLLITCAYGFAFGWLAMRLLKTWRVRNSGLAALVGLGAGGIALYFEWSGFLHALAEDGPWIARPAEIASLMSYLYEHGSWGLRSGGNVTGVMLAIVWIAEAGIIVGIAALVPYGFVSSTPFCEKALVWLDEERKIDTLESFTDPAQLAALKSGDLMPLTQARPKALNAATFTRLLLKRSPKCSHFCTVCVQNVAMETDDKNNVKEKTENVSGDLILPASMFELITQFEEFKPTPGPASA